MRLLGSALGHSELTGLPGMWVGVWYMEFNYLFDWTDNSADHSGVLGLSAFSIALASGLKVSAVACP